MRYVACFFFIILVSCSSSHEKIIEKKIATIPLEDKKKLEALFQQMMTGDYFPCTLFGNKPITFQEFQSDPWKISSQYMLNPYSFFYLEVGWETWEKYKPIFPSKRFIFTIVPCKVGYQFIILINRPAFEEIFQKNQDIFQNALGPKITSDKILKEFEAGQKTFEEILNNHEGLVGLVLGYGRENSMKTYRSDALQLQLLKKSFHPLTSASLYKELPKKTQNFLKVKEKKILTKGTKWHQILQYNDVQIDKKDICNELTKLSNNLEFFRLEGDYFPYYLESPNFSCIKDSKESNQLKKEYGDAMKKARKAFKQTSFLQGFLEQYSQ
jgi:hypothetical protein